MKERIVYYVKRLLCFVLKCFWILPVRRSTIVFFSYYGKGYSCNPKYIFEYIEREHPAEYDLQWQFIRPENFDFLKERGVRLAKYNSLHGMLSLMTAKVIITNCDYPIYIPFRKNQYLVNTWHGGGAYKKVGADMSYESPYRAKTYAISTQLVSLYLSSSKSFTELTVRGAFRYGGEVLECGMPRNDILLGGTSEIYCLVRKRLNLPLNIKVVLYAPTYRESRIVTDYGLDAVSLTDALRKRYGGEWVLMFRTHANLIGKLDSAELGPKVINVTDYNDMQELLCAADILITDYSSSMWDFSLTKKPCFIYATDREQYKGERAFYTPMERWPFPLAENNGQLAEAVLKFDETAYLKALTAHHKELGIRETGEASKIAAERILREATVKKVR